MSPGEGSPCLPTQKDVIFGRDTASWINGGNRLLRRMIEKHHEDYTPTMTAAEIRKLIAVIIGDLKSSGARFLKLDHSTQQYYEVDDKTCFDKVGRTIRDQHVTYQRRSKKRKKAEDAYRRQLAGSGSIDSLAASQPKTISTSTIMSSKRMQPPEFIPINDTKAVANPSLLTGEQETAAAMFEVMRRGVQDRNASGQPSRRPQVDAEAQVSSPMTLASRAGNADAQVYIADRSEYDTQGVMNPSLFTEEQKTAAVMFEVMRRGVQDRNATGQPTRPPQMEAEAKLAGPMTLTGRTGNADAQAYIAGRSEYEIHRTLAENLRMAGRVRMPHSPQHHPRMGGVNDVLLAASRDTHQLECELARRRQLGLYALNLLASEGRGHRVFNPYLQSEIPMFGLHRDRILAGGRGPLPAAPWDQFPSPLLRPPPTAPSIAPMFWLPDFSANL